VLAHRQAEPALDGAAPENRRGETARLGSEQKQVVALEGLRVVATLTACRERKPARRRDAREAAVEAVMHPNVRERVVVKTGPAQAALIEPEAERPDQVQPCAGVGTEADDVARVRRDLGFVKRDVENGAVPNYTARVGSRSCQGNAMTRVKHLLARKGRDVWSVDADQPVLEAIRIMAERHVGALPVLRGGALVGVMSERDYARKVVLLGRSSADTPVSQIMSSPAYTVTPDETVQRCMEIMTERRFRHLPVVNEGRMVGMISIGDCVRAVIDDQQDTIQQLERFISG
jgi:CBS domain-containing protein